MIDLKKLRTALILFFCITANSLCWGAMQGILGPTSTGIVDVTITIDSLAQITGLTDLSFGSWAGVSPDTRQSTACVYTNTGVYSITASSANTPGFRLTDGSSNFITYTATWDDGSLPAALTEGAALTTQTGDSSSTTCSGGTNATLAVSITSAAIGASPAGAYADILTLLITPT